MGFGAIIGLCNSIKILYQYASPHGRKKKVHMSFSGRCKAPLFGAVQDAVVKGGCEFTAIHTAQTEGWFEVWSAKARVADYVIVLFTAEYQSTFTPALKQEADLIHEVVRHAWGGGGGVTCAHVCVPLHCVHHPCTRLCTHPPSHPQGIPSHPSTLRYTHPYTFTPIHAPLHPHSYTRRARWCTSLTTSVPLDPRWPLPRFRPT